MLESHFNKVTGFNAWNFIKKRLQHRFFPGDIAKFLTLLRIRGKALYQFSPVTFTNVGFSPNLTCNIEDTGIHVF